MSDTPDTTDRTLGPWRRLLLSLLPSLPFLGLYEYRVLRSDGKTIDAQPTEESPPALYGAKLPSCSKIPALLGDQPVMTNGTIVLLSFVNGDPARPRFVSRDPTTKPKSVTLETTAAPATEHVATVEGVLNLFLYFAGIINSQNVSDASMTTALTGAKSLSVGLRAAMAAILAVKGAPAAGDNIGAPATRTG